MKINLGKRTVAALLCLAIIVGFLPAGALSAGNDAVDYLMLATDRYENSTIIGTLLSRIEGDIGDGELDYVGLGGDMVDQTNSYNSSTVLGEVTAAADHMTSANVDLLYSSHDENCTDDAGIMNLASGLWMTLDQCYVYGIIQSDVEDTTAAQLAAANFTKWVSSLTDDKAIIVLSHFPLHAKRGDNLGAGYWHNALNAAATGSADGSDVIRNVAFFHGHNHTVDETEYYYAPGQTVSIESYVSPTDTAALSDTISVVYDTERAVNATSEGTNATVYYTYATAGYLNANGQATLVTVSEDSITFAKYASGSEPVTLGTVERAVATVNTVGGVLDNQFEEIYATGLGLTNLDVVWYEEADLTELFGNDYYFAHGLTLTGYTEDTTVTITVKVYGEDLTRAVVYLFGALTDGQTATFNTVEAAAEYDPEADDGYGCTTITFEVDAAQEIIFAFGEQTITVPDGYALTELKVTSQPSKTKYFVEETNAEGVLPLDIAGLKITATYSDGVNSISKELEWDMFGEVEDGYALSVDMTQLGRQDVEVSYTYGDVTETATFPIWIGQEYFNQSGATVQVENPGTTSISVTDRITPAALRMISGVMSDYVVYNISLNSVDGADLDGGVAWVTLPIPAGVTKPVVYYVSDNGRVARNMNAAVNEDNTVTFKTDHFSTYVVGQDAGLESDAFVPGLESTLQNVVGDPITIYKLVDTPVSGKQYLIVSTNTGTGNGLNSTTAGYATTAFTNNGTYYTAWNSSTNQGTPLGAGTYLTTNGAYLWTMTSTTSGWTVSHTENGNTSYVGWNQQGSGQLGGTKYANTLLLPSTSAQHWTLGTNLLTVNLLTYDAWLGDDSHSDYYLAYSGGAWTMAVAAELDDGTNAYFYEPITVYPVTQTGHPAIPEATYHMDLTVDGNAVTNHAYTVTSVVNGTKAQVWANFAKTVEGTTSATDWPAGGSFTVLSSSNSAVATMGNDGVLTFTGVSGQTLVQVEYTWTENGRTCVTQNYVVVTAVAPVYDMRIVDPGSTQLKIGATMSLSAVRTQDGTPENVGSNVTWSSSNPAIATVNETTGVVTGKGSGDVTITATWTDPSGIEHTDSVDLSVVDAIYTLDLCKPAYTMATEYVAGTTYFTEKDGVYTAAPNVTASNFNSGVYYTQSAEPITAPIVIKDVQAGQSYANLWAVITADGVDLGKLNDEQLKKLTYISSDEAIATADKNTGHITFQGKTGTVTITAIYEYADGRSVMDSVVFSVSNQHYFIPEDGTNDFPEYPNEGSVRFDKTATPVGNFNETGLVQMELSMTGVPFTTGNEIDVVIMIDLSSSMNQNNVDRETPAKTAAQEALKILVTKTGTDNEFNGNRVAIYGFNGWYNSASSYDQYVESVYEYYPQGDTGSGTSNYNIDRLAPMQTYDTAKLNAANTSIDGAELDSGTNYAAALRQCYLTLEATRQEGRQQFVIFLTDGAASTGFAYDNNGNKALYKNGTLGNDGFDNISTVASKQEWYSKQMKEAGVEVYTVGLQIKGGNDTETAAAKEVLQKIAGTKDGDATQAGYESYAMSIEANESATEVVNAFQKIAQKIMEAAKDVVVEDEMGENFNMVFETPNDNLASALNGQEYFIEVGEYVLDENKNRTDQYTQHVKLYMGTNVQNGTETYYAASDAKGTAYATPVFAQTPLGSLYYWTTDASKGDRGISVPVGGTTYYFVSSGTGTHNMISGAYAYGTVKDHYLEGTVTDHSSEDLIIATPQFVYNAATKTLDWTLEKIGSTEWVMRYFLHLEQSGGYVDDNHEYQIDPGTYETNKGATLTYENFQGNDAQQEFPDPQVTWNGAQVSYVFYLVNENGEPVNRAGYVVPFSEAVYVTDPVRQYVYWNTAESMTRFESDLLAQELVPDVYELFDTGAAYNIHVYADEKGVNLNNHFKIEANLGISKYTTYVFNTKADDEKYTNPGTYKSNDGSLTYYEKEYLETDRYTVDENGKTITLKNGYTISNQVVPSTGMSTEGAYRDAAGHLYYKEGQKWYTIVTAKADSKVHDNFNFYDTTVAFAVKWKPQLVEDVVVVDFGLPVVVDVTMNDALSATVVGVRATAPGGILINTGTYNAAGNPTVDLWLDGRKLGTASVDSMSSVRFELDSQYGMQFTKPITFYYETEVSYYTSGVLTTRDMYSSVTVIPATTIYYEDSFVTTSSYEWKDNGDGVTDTNDWAKENTNRWTTVGNTVSNATQAQDRPGKSVISAVYDADNLYGYDAAYKTMTEYSLGSAQKITVDYDHMGTAEFTFYGTGFDVISLTSNATGTLIVDVYAGDSASGTAVKSFVVDTYYGYSYVDGEWVLKPQEPNALYQVPVMKVFDLPYGQYTAKITAIYGRVFAHPENKGSYDLYLDAIRIYDPAGDGAADAFVGNTVQDVYISDQQGWPVYQELRNGVIDATQYVENLVDYLTGKVDPVFSGGTNFLHEGALFVDGVGKTNINENFINFGPNNELYLAPGQSTGFTLVSHAYMTDIALGIKVGNGDAVEYTINGDAYTVDTTNCMYYSLNDYKNAEVIVIKNVSGGILSLTNLRATFTRPTDMSTLVYVNQQTVEATLMMLRGEKLLSPPVIDWPALEQPEEPGLFETVFGGIGDFFANLFDSLFGWIFA